MRIEIDSKSYLEINLVHQDGAYKVYFSKYFKDDGGFVHMYPFADGNFTIKMGVGRKSPKKLQKIGEWLSSQSDNLFAHWTRGEYQEIANCLFNFWGSL